MSGYKHILIATDGSECSSKGVDAGLNLARQLGAKVTMITISEPVHHIEIGRLLQNQQAMDNFNVQRRKAAEIVLSDAQATAAAAGVECQTLYIENVVPATAILNESKARYCDLIVMTSHGRKGFERFVLGSQTSRVVQSSEISVLVVR